MYIKDQLVNISFTCNHSEEKNFIFEFTTQGIIFLFVVNLRIHKWDRRIHTRKSLNLIPSIRYHSNNLNDIAYSNSKD